jgi:hypothetical protein
MLLITIDFYFYVTTFAILKHIVLIEISYFLKFCLRHIKCEKQLILLLGQSNFGLVSVYLILFVYALNIW